MLPAQVELRDGRVVGTLGRHGATASKRTVVSSKLLSELEQGDFFGGGSLLIGEGELQVNIRRGRNGGAAVLLCSPLP